MTMKNPPHPGDFIWTEIIEPRHLSVTAAAAMLGVSRTGLSNLVNEKADLSAEMAMRIEEAFGVDMDTFCGCSRLTTSRKREIGTRPPSSAKNLLMSIKYSANSSERGRCSKKLSQN